MGEYFPVRREIIVPLENRTADAVVNNLRTLGITRLAEWDVLAFVHRHGTSLGSPERIASLLGYNKAAVASALDSLTSMGLVQRSRNSHGVRLYQFVGSGPDDPLQRALEDLIEVGDKRQGRLLLIKHLRKAADDNESRGRGGLHLA